MKRLVLPLFICLLSPAFGQEPDQGPKAEEEAAVEMEPETVVIPAERKAMDLLAKFQSSDSVVWLQADGEEFLALYQPALKGRAEGSVLLLHAEGQHADWPGALSYLRKRLPEWGWNTLSITLPDPDPTPKPTNPEEPTEIPGEVLDETEEVFDPETNTVGDGSVMPETENSEEADVGRAEEIAVERIVAAFNRLIEEGSRQVVVYGQGLGALRASRFWQETADNNIGALVFVDAINGLNNSDFTLTQSLTNPGMPILDVIQTRQKLIEMDAKQRSDLAKMNELLAYQQVQSTDNSELLATTIYGFFRRHSK